MTICFFYDIFSVMCQKWSRVLVVFANWTRRPLKVLSIFLSAHLTKCHTLCEPRSRPSGQSHIPLRTSSGSNISLLLTDEPPSPSVSPLPAQAMPSRSSWLKITLKPPTQTQEPSRALCTIHKDQDLDSDIESEDDKNDHRGTESGR
jgi:hypothetical protein